MILHRDTLKINLQQITEIPNLYLKIYGLFIPHESFYGKERLKCNIVMIVSKRKNISNICINIDRNISNMSINEGKYR